MGKITDFIIVVQIFVDIDMSLTPIFA